MNLIESSLTDLLALRPHMGKADNEKCMSLLTAFFLIETRWLNHMGDLNDWYCVDLTTYIIPQTLPATIEQRFHQSGFSSSSHETKACLNYLRWNMLKHEAPKEIARYGLPNPYEPLIAFFQLGGEFSVEQHFADVAVVDDGVCQRIGVLTLSLLRQRLLRDNQSAS